MLEWTSQTTSAQLKILLLLLDSENAERSLVDLTLMCSRNNATLIVANSQQEAARYLETFRAYANRGAEHLKERTDSSLLAMWNEMLTINRLVNKTDVHTLHSVFGSIAHLSVATEQQLVLCPGIGPSKVRRLREAFTEPFVPRYVRQRTINNEVSKQN